MDVTEVISEFGAYFIASGQGPNDITKVMNFKSETDELFTRIETEDTVIRRGSSLMTRVLQPFQKGWTPTGALTFKPHAVTLYPMKVDVEEYPDELVATWLGFLASENVNRTEWPFVRWWLQQVVDQEIEDYEREEVFAGEYDAPTDGTAGAAGTAMEGIKKLINDGVTATTITPIATGAPNADNEVFVGQVETFIDSIDERYRNRPMTLAMSTANAVKFKRGMRKKYNMSYDQISDTLTVADYDNITVKGYASFKNSNKMFCTPIQNAICGVKWDSKTPGIEGEDRKVKMWYDYHKGIGFILHELVFTNDQDLAV
jgi:hypothetical protein